MPDRSTFAQPEYARALKPYLALTHAVRRGSLLDFNAQVAKHADAFKVCTTTNNTNNTNNTNTNTTNPTT